MTKPSYPLAPVSARIQRLNRRQRKKLEVGEFQKPTFYISFQLRAGTTEAQYDSLWDDFIDFIESLQLSATLVTETQPVYVVRGHLALALRDGSEDAQRDAVVKWLGERELVVVSNARSVKLNPN